MKQFKIASTIKPIRSTRTLSLTVKESENRSSKKGKRGHRKSGSVANSKIHQAYSTKMPLTEKNKDAKEPLLGSIDEVKAAKGIFITNPNEENEAKLETPKNKSDIEIKPEKDKPDDEVESGININPDQTQKDDAKQEKTCI